MPTLARVVAAVLAAAALGAAPGAVDLAVLHADRRLQPLARLAGNTWSPLTPADAAGEWGLWLFDDPVVKTSPFDVRSAQAFAAAAATGPCLPVSGLDAPARPALGLALRGTDIRPDLPVAVDPASDFGRQLGARAAAAFHRAEDETLTLESEELPAGFPRFADRRQRPVTWKVMARQGLAQAPAKTYYLEGEKDYPGFRGRTDIGQIRTTGHVFVQLTGARETIDAEVDLSDAAGIQSKFRTPLAIVAWPARTAWLFATRGADGAHLEIVELTPGISRPRLVWQGPDRCP